MGSTFNPCNEGQVFLFSRSWSWNSLKRGEGLPFLKNVTGKLFGQKSVKVVMFLVLPFQFLIIQTTYHAFQALPNGFATEI